MIVHFWFKRQLQLTVAIGDFGAIHYQAILHLMRTTTPE